MAESKQASGANNSAPRRQYAVALLELGTTAAGIAAADTVLKTADCALYHAATVCPGKFLLLIGGDLAPVREAYEQVEKLFAGDLHDGYILGHVAPGLLQAVGGTASLRSREGSAIGVFEAFTATAALVGADTALKAANVELLDVRLAQGMAGKGVAYICGTVAAVEAALAAAAAAVRASGGVCSTACLASPHAAVWEAIVG